LLASYPSALKARGAGVQFEAWAEVHRSPTAADWAPSPAFAQLHAWAEVPCNGSAGSRKGGKGKGRKADAKADEADPSEFTTLMIRNFPQDHNTGKLVALLQSLNLGGLFDFVYMPADFTTNVLEGYGFVNFCTPADAVWAWRQIDGYRIEGSRKELNVGWGIASCQGLHKNLERYRNSPVMHESVDARLRPVYFEHGQQVCFPPPTKRIRPPRLKNRGQ